MRCRTLPIPPRHYVLPKREEGTGMSRASFCWSVVAGSDGGRGISESVEDQIRETGGVVERINRDGGRRLCSEAQKTAICSKIAVFCFGLKGFLFFRKNSVGRARRSLCRGALRPCTFRGLCRGWRHIRAVWLFWQWPACLRKRPIRRRRAFRRSGAWSP